MTVEAAVSVAMVPAGGGIHAFHQTTVIAPRLADVGRTAIHETPVFVTAIHGTLRGIAASAVIVVAEWRVPVAGYCRHDQGTEKHERKKSFHSSVHIMGWKGEQLGQEGTDIRRKMGKTGLPPHGCAHANHVFVAFHRTVGTVHIPWEAGHHVLTKGII